jgi:hypothetical protein
MQFKKAAAGELAVQKQKEQAAMLTEDSGAGLAGLGAADFEIPRLKIMQQLSPYLDPIDSRYLPDAKVGDVWDPVNRWLYKAGNPLCLLFLNQRKSVTRWKSKAAGGGFVADYGSDLSILDETDRGRPPKFTDGDELLIAAEYFSFLIDPTTGDFNRVILSLSKSQFRKSLKLNSIVASTMVPGSRQVAPMFYRVFRCSTVLETWMDKRWYGWKVEPDCPIFDLPRGNEIYIEARNFVLAASGNSGEPPSLPAIAAVGAVDDSDIPY